ncbi:hypothetical protein [Neoroseomonas lacus]|uniref:Uncharacterized protein n=1 Tax=Neoroseomonas lacus TaxID=287609 RepID=A0A917NJ13_9PROT|nr:hypothetical protein [Neoroseomonas lacus]GGJ01401.1 hypothetical protein GCM10011320_05320 [Neoroseomonas lacus]
MPLPVLTTAPVLDQPASAARTPTDQRLAKFRAVINDPVACIEFLRNDVWRVSGACWRVDIALVGTPRASRVWSAPGSSSYAPSTEPAPERHWRSARARMPRRRPHSAAITRRMRPIAWKAET